MSTATKTIVALENKFWQSMVDQDTDTALAMISEPSMMVSEHGAMKFDHAGYRKMAEGGTTKVTSFKFSDVEVVFPNDTTAVMSYHVQQEMSSGDTGKKTRQEMNDSSTWIKTSKGWQCALHTETPAAKKH